MVLLETWLYAIASVLIVSAISLIGVITISIKEEKLAKILLYLVGFSAGGLLGGAFIHLLPEAVEASGFGLMVSVSVLSGMIVFFIMEKAVHWRHCHVPTSKSHPHPFAYMNLVGDSVHNFIDGLIIGASYLASVPIGIVTTLAVVFHEIPQEIGDFGVLLHGGFSRKKALYLNFITALTAVAGTIVAIIASYAVENLTAFLVPFAAGGFIYIASSDLIPELHKDAYETKKSFVQLLTIVLGIAVIFALKILVAE
ncbi:MAG: ZIP family metal transporter [Candidatus Aenigmarchaeota archaeon]|nr:ZIP family metal transporter [Candidatus Aenigmarchaeota archaeon]